MKTNQVNNLIERMKTDYSFRNEILFSKSIKEKLALCKELGFNVSEDDFATLSLNENNSENRDNLANTWLCKGPCHTKCAPISAN